MFGDGEDFGAFEAADGDEAGPLAGALVAADADEARTVAAAIEAADGDEADAVADAIEAAEADEERALAAAVDDEGEGLDAAADRRALLFAEVGIILAVVVAVEIVAYTPPPPPAAGRAHPYPGDAANALPIIDNGFQHQFRKGGTSIWAGWGSESVQPDASEGLQRTHYYLGPADAHLPPPPSRRFVRPTSLLLTAAVYAAYYHPRFRFVDHVILALVAVFTALVLYTDGARGEQPGHNDTADEGFLSWIELWLPNIVRYLRRG